MVDYVAPGMIDSTAGSLGFRNRIINGAFDVWQRGTAETFSNSTYTADRWTCAGYQQSRHSRQSIGSVAGLYSRYCLQSASSTTSEVAAGTRCDVSQKIENLNCYDLAGRSITVSFWVKFSAATATSIANSGGSSFGASWNSYLQYNTTTTDSATSSDTGDSNFQMFNISNGSLPTTWTKYSCTLTVPSNVNNITFRAQFVGLGSTTVASTVWFQIAEIQLELGSIATAFERRPYGMELALCQRYYVSLTEGNTTFSGNITNGYSYYTQYILPVTMRVTPTASGTDVGPNGFGGVGTLTPRGLNVITEGRTATGTVNGAYYGSNIIASAEL